MGWELSRAECPRADEGPSWQSPLGVELLTGAESAGRRTDLARLGVRDGGPAEMALEPLGDAGRWLTGVVECGCGVSPETADKGAWYPTDEIIASVGCTNINFPF